METKKLVNEKKRRERRAAHRGLGELGSVIIALLLAVLLITSGTIFYGGIFARYGVANYTNATTGTGASEAYNTLNSNVTEMGKTLQGSNAVNTNVFFVMFAGAFSAAQTLFSVTGIAASLVFNTGGYFGTTIGVDVGWIIAILVGIFTVFVILKLFEGGTGRTW